MMSSFESTKTDIIEGLHNIHTAKNKYGIWLLKILHCNPEIQKSFKHADCITISYHTYQNITEMYGDKIEVTPKLKNEYGAHLADIKKKREEFFNKGEPIPEEYKLPPIPEVHRLLSLFNVDLVRNLLSEMDEGQYKTLDSMKNLSEVIDDDKMRNDYDDKEERKKLYQRKAVQLLLNLVKKVKEVDEDHPINKEEYMGNETNWCSVLACHLLEPLTGSSVILENHYKNKGYKKCPACGKKVRFGDTSLGDLNFWHGSPDVIMSNVGIILENPQPVIVGNSFVDDLYWKQVECKILQDGAGNMSIKKIPTEARGQTLSQCITFGCIKRDDLRDSNLVPNILIAGKYVQIYMYNAINDMLMESTVLSLKDDDTNTLSIDTIIIIWFALHWNLFCTGPTTRMNDQNFKSGFIQAIKDRGVYDKYISGMHITGRSKVTLYGNYLDIPNQVTFSNVDDMPLMKRKLSSTSASSEDSTDCISKRTKRMDQTASTSMLNT